ncbi:MAG: hypothetical protein LIO74_11575 [Ruminococcus sp.]|nr:hypothetical protein [Ruminococcus sp.]
MNKLKKTLALVAVLAMTAVAFVGCDDDEDEESSTTSTAESSAIDESSEDAEASEEAEEGDSESTDDSDSSTTAEAPTPDGTLGDDGDQLSILCWTDTDLNAMLEVTSAENATYVNVGSDGTEASEQYITYFSSGEDVDLYFCDADWTMAYVNNDEYSAPLSALGIDESYYSDAYSYTVAVGTSDAGVLKAASFQAAGGVYAYRTDLAEEYLGVTTPDEMQAYVSDWDTFWSTAATVYEASDGVTAMADTIAGVWRAYSCDRTTAWVIDDVFTYDDTLTTTIDTIYDAYTSGYICNSIEQWTNDWYAIGYATGSLANNTMGYFFPSWSLTSTGHLASAEGYNWEIDSFDNVGTSGLYAVTKDSSGWYWGGTWICVSPLCDNATAAAQFMYDMTINAETMKEYAVNHSDFVNNQTVMQEIIDEGSNTNTLLQEGYQDQFPALADSAASIDLDGVATEYDGTVTNDLVTSITSYCQGGLSSAEDCLDDFLDTVAADLPDVTVD